MGKHQKGTADAVRKLLGGASVRLVLATTISPGALSGRRRTGEPSGMYAQNDVVLGRVRVRQVREGPPSQTSDAVAHSGADARY
jgi:hypothetical protein